jgi:hypothetical protein
MASTLPASVGTLVLSPGAEARVTPPVGVVNSLCIFTIVSIGRNSPAKAGDVAILYILLGDLSRIISFEAAGDILQFMGEFENAKFKMQNAK